MLHDWPELLGKAAVTHLIDHPAAMTDSLESISDDEEGEDVNLQCGTFDALANIDSDSNSSECKADTEAK